MRSEAINVLTSLICASVELISEVALAGPSIASYAGGTNDKVGSLARHARGKAYAQETIADCIAKSDRKPEKAGARVTGGDRDRKDRSH